MGRVRTHGMRYAMFECYCLYYVSVLSCMVNNHHGTAKYDDPLKQTRNSLQSVNHYATNNA